MEAQQLGLMVAHELAHQQAQQISYLASEFQQRTRFSILVRLFKEESRDGLRGHGIQPKGIPSKKSKHSGDDKQKDDSTIHPLNRQARRRVSPRTAGSSHR